MTRGQLSNWTGNRLQLSKRNEILAGESNFDDQYTLQLYRLLNPRSEPAFFIYIYILLYGFAFDLNLFNDSKDEVYLSSPEIPIFIDILDAVVEKMATAGPG